MTSASKHLVNGLNRYLSFLRTWGMSILNFLSHWAHQTCKANTWGRYEKRKTILFEGGRDSIKLSLVVIYSSEFYTNIHPLENPTPVTWTFSSWPHLSGQAQVVNKFAQFFIQLWKSKKQNYSFFPAGRIGMKFLFCLVGTCLAVFFLIILLKLRQELLIWKPKLELKTEFQKSLANSKSKNLNY